MPAKGKNSGNVSEDRKPKITASGSGEEIDQLLKVQTAQKAKEIEEELALAYATETDDLPKAIPFVRAADTAETMDEMVARLKDDPRILKRKLNKAHLHIDDLEERYADLVDEFNGYMMRVEGVQLTIATLVRLADEQMEKVAPDVGQAFVQPLHDDEKFNKEASM